MTIVVYFSHAGQNYFSGGYKYLTEGNASKIAKKVKQKTNADIFEVVAEKPYPEGYKECCDVALAEQRQNTFQSSWQTRTFQSMTL